MIQSFKKLLLSGAVAILASSSAFAQGPVSGIAAQSNVNAAAGGAVFRTFDGRFEGIKGNPFFVNAWLPGSITIKKNNAGSTEEFKNLKVKYDVHGNQLAAVVPETKDTILINADVVSTFKVDMPLYNNLVEFRTFAEARALDPKLSSIFFAVLYDGNTKLVKGVSKRLVKADYKGAYSGGNAYDELVDETQYYLVTGKNMVKTKLTRKALLDAMPAQQEVLKAYIASQKLAMNSEADFIKVLTYRDSL
ncbi:hypothetical protein GU926_02530 [Nibribacter ruber]|uniref:Uncharacterized protein n=1 Tax=Nibribacter ruber TaxID=2698458 RepID=A0A6P1NWR4_9BACT|nr:hypothetical protein [Nibribacter ruber]QHL86378.1 hypothetical protein GU926_02530 [Nibribacter ruber]